MQDVVDSPIQNSMGSNKSWILTRRSSLLLVATAAMMSIVLFIFFAIICHLSSVFSLVLNFFQDVVNCSLSHELVPESNVSEAFDPSGAFLALERPKTKLCTFIIATAGRDRRDRISGPSTTFLYQGIKF
jgi:hypothetical protein